MCATCQLDHEPFCPDLEVRDGRGESRHRAMEKAGKTQDPPARSREPETPEFRSIPIEEEADSEAGAEEELKSEVEVTGPKFAPLRP